MKMNLERRTYDIDGYKIELRTDGRPMIKGHAAVFNQVSDRGGWFLEKIAPGAFADSLKADDVRATFNHDPNIVLGRNKAGTLRLSEDTKGLFAEIDPPETQQAKDLLISIERGDISQMSFAFETLGETWEGEQEPRLRTLTKVRLYDVSAVTYPFYEGTDVAVRSYDNWRAAQEPGTPEHPWRRELLRRRIRIFDMAVGKFSQGG
jgi:hypothetical protein